MYRLRMSGESSSGKLIHTEVQISRYSENADPHLNSTGETGSGTGRNP